jgi:RNA polymerase sigma-70 factor (ECF subfamily)
LSVTPLRPLADVDDRALIAAFQRSRSEHGARELIVRHSPRLLRTVARVLGDRSADAEDVLQDAWVRGLAAIDRYRGEAAFSTWMTRVALRCALDHLRARDNRTPLLSLDDARAVASPPTEHELGADLDVALSRLSSHARSVVILHDIEGWTHAEIATELGIAVGTSKAHLFQARRRLRALLDPPRGTTREETA